MGKRLLLVESDSTLCGQLARFLTTLGYKVDAVGSVGAALAAIKFAPPELTLLDAQLDEDPATIAFATRQCDASLIIMGRPELADALVIDIGVEVTPDQVLHKPFSAQSLSAMVKAALQARVDKAEAERQRLQDRSELDDELGALQAALGELTEMHASAGPAPRPQVEPGSQPPAPQPPAPQSPAPAVQAEPLESTPSFESTPPLESTPAVQAEPMQSTPAVQAEPVQSTPPVHSAPPPARVSRPIESPLLDPSATPKPVAWGHELLVADAAGGSGASPTPTPPSGAPARSVVPSARILSAMSPLLDASVLPAVPLESAELIAQFALQPMTAESPLDPRGIYGPVTMPELLYSCFRDLFSGWLLLRRDTVTKTVLLRGGRPIFAQSNIKAETLGSRLVTTGRLSPEDSERSLRYADGLGIRQGEAIVHLGMLSEEGLRDGLRDQLTTRLVNCFSWSQAEYGLTYDPEASEGAEASEVNPLVVIFEGVKTRYPLAPLMAHYDLLVRQAPRATARLADYKTMLREYRDELAVAEACDGSRSLGEVLSTSPLGLIGTLRVMRALESMNCLTYGSVTKTASMSGSRLRVTSATLNARPSGPVPADALRSIRRSGSDSGNPRRPDTSPASGGARTQRDERTTTGSQKILRPPGAHAAGIRRAGTRRTDGTSEIPGPASRAPASRRTDTRGPQSRGPQSRGPQSRGPQSRGPQSRGPQSRGPQSRGPQSNGPTARGQTPSGVPEPASAHDETPSALLARLEAAENSYALLDVALTANRASISKSAARLMRMLTQVATDGDADIERAARALFTVVEKAGEALTNPQLRRTYDALNLTIQPAKGIDLVAAESDFKLGRICKANQAMDRARLYFERAAIQDPHQAIYQVYLAWATFVLAPDTDRRTRIQAVELAREALKSDASRDDGYVLLGRMYQAINSHDQAVRAFGKALDINSGNTDARAGLDQLESDQGDAKKDTGIFGNLFSRR